MEINDVKQQLFFDFLEILLPNSEKIKGSSNQNLNSFQTPTKPTEATIHGHLNEQFKRLQRHKIRVLCPSRCQGCQDISSEFHEQSLSHLYNSNNTYDTPAFPRPKKSSAQASPESDSKLFGYNSNLSNATENFYTSPQTGHHQTPRCRKQSNGLLTQSEKLFSSDLTSTTGSNLLFSAQKTEDVGILTDHNTGVKSKNGIVVETIERRMLNLLHIYNSDSLSDCTLQTASAYLRNSNDREQGNPFENFTVDGDDTAPANRRSNSLSDENYLPFSSSEVIRYHSDIIRKWQEASCNLRAEIDILFASFILCKATNGLDTNMASAEARLVTVQALLYDLKSQGVSTSSILSIVIISICLHRRIEKALKSVEALQPTPYLPSTITTAAASPYLTLTPNPSPKSHEKFQPQRLLTNVTCQTDDQMSINYPFHSPFHSPFGLTTVHAKGQVEHCNTIKSNPTLTDVSDSSSSLNSSGSNSSLKTAQQNNHNYNNHCYNYGSASNNYSSSYNNYFNDINYPNHSNSVGTKGHTIPNSFPSPLFLPTTIHDDMPTMSTTATIYPYHKVNSSSPSSAFCASPSFPLGPNNSKIQPRISNNNIHNSANSFTFPESNPSLGRFVVSQSCGTLEYLWRLLPFLYLAYVHLDDNANGYRKLCHMRICPVHNGNNHYHSGLKNRIRNSTNGTDDTYDVDPDNYTTEFDQIGQREMERPNIRWQEDCTYGKEGDDAINCGDIRQLKRVGSNYVKGEGKEKIVKSLRHENINETGNFGECKYCLKYSENNMYGDTMSRFLNILYGKFPFTLLQHCERTHELQSLQEAAKTSTAFLFNNFVFSPPPLVKIRSNPSTKLVNGVQAAMTDNQRAQVCQSGNTKLHNFYACPRAQKYISFFSDFDTSHPFVATNQSTSTITTASVDHSFPYYGGSDSQDCIQFFRRLAVLSAAFSCSSKAFLPSSLCQIETKSSHIKSPTGFTRMGSMTGSEGNATTPLMLQCLTFQFPIITRSNVLSAAIKALGQIELCCIHATPHLSIATSYSTLACAKYHSMHRPSNDDYAPLMGHTCIMQEAFLEFRNSVPTDSSSEAAANNTNSTSLIKPFNSFFSIFSSNILHPINALLKIPPNDEKKLVIFKDTKTPKRCGCFASIFDYFKFTIFPFSVRLQNRYSLTSNNAKPLSEAIQIYFPPTTHHHHSTYPFSPFKAAPAKTTKYHCSELDTGSTCRWCVIRMMAPSITQFPLHTSARKSSSQQQLSRKSPVVLQEDTKSTYWPQMPQLNYAKDNVALRSVMRQSSSTPLLLLPHSTIQYKDESTHQTLDSLSRLPKPEEDHPYLPKTSSDANEINHSAATSTANNTNSFRSITASSPNLSCGALLNSLSADLRRKYPLMTDFRKHFGVYLLSLLAALDFRLHVCPVEWADCIAEVLKDSHPFIIQHAFVLYNFDFEYTKFKHL